MSSAGSHHLGSHPLPPRRWMPGARWVIGVPMVWLGVFFLLPFAILVRISLTDMGSGVDPFAPVLSVVDGAWRLSLKWDNFLSIVSELDAQGQRVWGHTLYIDAYLASLRYAAWTTVLCLVLGYPAAYFMARARPSARPALLMLVMLPFWTSFLLRVYAWKGILADQGVVNQALMALGLIQEPLALLYSDVSMLLGMTYVYCPFMILPLYAQLVKMDVRLLEAAYDLGTTPFKAFWLITVPLSRAGIVAGCTLVFIPAVGEFVVPSLLGGADNVLIGRVVWDEMFSANNWPRAAALAVTMIVLILVPLALNQRARAEPPAAAHPTGG
jgi:putrescine transport system permease protein